MADQGAKISSLPAAAQADIQTTDVVAGVSGGATKKITFATVLAWIAARLSKSDVGLGNVDDIRQYSASNPPPYPVTSVNGETGAVSLTIPAASSTTPAMDGTADAGSSSDYARGDHVHPTDTTRQALITATGVLAGDGSGGVSAITVDSAPDAAHTNNLISSAAVAGVAAGVGIVETGNTASQNIASGQYVVWKGALYKASAAISAGGTLSGSNLTAVSGGGLNDVVSNIKIPYIVLTSTDNLNDISTGIQYGWNDSDAPINSPTTVGGTCIAFKYPTGLTEIVITRQGVIWTRAKSYSTFTAWRQYQYVT